jgi:transposase
VKKCSFEPLPDGGLVMSSVLMVGADVHDANILTKSAVGRCASRRNTWRNNAKGREAMIAGLKKIGKELGAGEVVFVYEASGLGFGLYDDLKDAGIECMVLAPTKMEHSQKDRREKTDEKDAERALKALRSHVLAGAELAKVWVPDLETRDDRELVRSRLDVGEKSSSVKTQIRCLLKRNRIEREEEAGKAWTCAYLDWLEGLTRGGPLGSGARFALASLLRQLKALGDEEKTLDAGIKELSESARYKAGVTELTEWVGVGLLIAMVFLTEMGDLKRFKNRRQVGAYLGLVPSSHESGENDDRKGHITHQGSRRLRKVLCQATWSRIRCFAPDHESYDRIVKKNPKHKKIAVVATMRKLGIRMWHEALKAQG